jgi:hypothetical protein
MLVTFSCPAYADITMFGNIATHLIKLMGHSGSVPGAILAEDVPQALQQLNAAIEREKQQEAQHGAANPQDDEPVITTSMRALPLQDLLKAAADAKCNVMWDVK